MKLQGLGQLSFDVNYIFKTLINQIIADYQAKIGNFMSAKQKILLLQSRNNQLARYPSITTQSVSLAPVIAGLLSTQGALEVSGLNIINIVNTVKSNPVVSKLLAGTLSLSNITLTDISTISGMYNSIMKAKNDMGTFVDSITTHMNNITNVENQIIALETSVGIKQGGFNVMGLLTTKNLLIAGGVLFIATKGFGLLKAIKKYRKG